MVSQESTHQIQHMHAGRPHRLQMNNIFAGKIPASQVENAADSPDRVFLLYKCTQTFFGARRRFFGRARISRPFAVPQNGRDLQAHVVREHCGSSESGGDQQTLGRIGGSTKQSWSEVYLYTIIGASPRSSIFLSFFFFFSRQAMQIPAHATPPPLQSGAGTRGHRHGAHQATLQPPIATERER
jgi:hypothetical protein